MQHFWGNKAEWTSNQETSLFWKGFNQASENKTQTDLYSLFKGHSSTARGHASLATSVAGPSRSLPTPKQEPAPEQSEQDLEPKREPKNEPSDPSDPPPNPVSSEAFQALIKKEFEKPDKKTKAMLRLTQMT
ncbi:hypothetical protein PHLCEN_2v4067 [Hermanssonia centrifuga]|uniref:Uncharacterized protein n=1 Tax=Hermanssonia centrifuga TaxID=98765 RepID=A0A2R6Q5C9_9APHY|nr:hypothetical protein PHLCEN_2v4067 [Hermanssonia centrifuga]